MHAMTCGGSISEIREGVLESQDLLRKLEKSTQKLSAKSSKRKSGTMQSDGHRTTVVNAQGDVSGAGEGSSSKTSEPPAKRRFLSPKQVDYQTPDSSLAHARDRRPGTSLPSPQESTSRARSTRSPSVTSSWWKLDLRSPPRTPTRNSKTLEAAESRNIRHKDRRKVSKAKTPVQARMYIVHTSLVVQLLSENIISFLAKDHDAIKPTKMQDLGANKPDTNPSAATDDIDVIHGSAIPAPTPTGLIQHSPTDTETLSDNSSTVVFTVIGKNSSAPVPTQSNTKTTDQKTASPLLPHRWSEQEIDSGDNITDEDAFKVKVTGPQLRQRSATEIDARRHRIPRGYSLKNWDPEEDPILLLGSVFHASSLGKWIIDWTYHHHGAESPQAKLAKELKILLTDLFSKVKRAEESIPVIRDEENREIIVDFIEAGERLTARLRRLLKACEAPMLIAGENGGEEKDKLGKTAGVEFVDTIFGEQLELQTTQSFMEATRLWNLRFDANCEDVLRDPLLDSFGNAVACYKVGGDFKSYEKIQHHLRNARSGT
ncbi:hypothetical protein G7Y89_g7211 [Cudoniella acicularis]|uniref:Uncharacterized protein n=1 Tax=Cudoniella acicularis TaxID=354080 RepID=A0A8H4RLL9_9HELO|nr:hypothetical protein G7Y89_g7211 [Cudoniella acicularis]